MRVLFVSPASELGGAERCLLDFIAVLQANGVSVAVVTLADGPLVREACSLGATAEVVEPPPELAEFGESASDRLHVATLLAMAASAPRALRFMARLHRAVVRAQPDVVHTNGMKAHLLAGLVCPARARLVVHLHDFVGSRRASRWLLPALSRLRPKAIFIANSRAVAEDFAAIAPNAEVRTVYNVVDTDYFCPGVSEPAWLAGLADSKPPPDNAITFGLVATYARWKGHDLFIESAGLLQAAHPSLPLRFYVVGGPIYKTLGSQVQAPELLERARAARIETNFGLVPFADDVARVYRSLSVMVHASTRPEPFGRTIVEAMACGRPVLVARAGGAAELFQEDENALGYTAGDATALADVMGRALDGELRARLARAARAHAVRNFGRSRLAAELLRVYSAAR